MQDANNKALFTVRNERCEFLGLKDDPQTSLAFPSNWNYCYFAHPSSPVRLEHQRLYCQSAAHLACAVLLQKEPGPLPANIRGSRVLGIGPGVKSRRGLLPILILLALVGAAIWYASSGRPMPSVNWGPAAEWYNIFFGPTATQVADTMPTIQSPTLALVAPASTPTFAPSPTAAPTWTVLLQQHTLESPVHVDQRIFLIHQVKGGETYEVLTKSYDTTADVIRALNGDLKPSLWANTQIIISPGLKEVDPTMPVFHAYQVKVASITIDQLALGLGAEPGPVRVYNGCLDNCTLVQGDWVIVPRAQ